VFRAMFLYSLERISRQMLLKCCGCTCTTCCYAPPSANSQYLDNMCAMLYNACDVNRDLYFLGNLNIDWLATSYPTKRTRLIVTNACNMTQVIAQSTRVHSKCIGSIEIILNDYIGYVRSLKVP
jgi:hypothetical protein